MCGIIGFCGEFSPDQLSAGNGLQRHRGPDDSGTYVDEAQGVGLGHRRLSILDLSPLGHQPMFDGDGAVVLTLNGEIYNFRELRAELVARGERFRSQSDTEVLLRMYLLDGPKFLSRLNGIFAFAIWDKREQSLLVARDHLGIKPLYYSESSRGFAFASEIKGLQALVPEAAELDVASLDRYMTFLWCPGDGTPLQNVRKVAPGEALIVKRGRIVGRWTWYQLPAVRGVTPSLREPDAVAGTVIALREAVHRQLVADVPVGAFLSGGLDSSAIVAFAREQVPGIRCFTIENVGGQESGMADDLPYAHRVAKHLGVALDVVTVDASRMADDVAMLIGQLDEPLADPAPLNVLYISELARRHGIKVLLSGAGGDDLFGGYRRHLAVAYEQYWRWMPSWARTAVEARTRRLDQRKPLFRRLVRLFHGAGLSGDERLVRYFHWASRDQLRELYSDDFRARLGEQRADQPMLDFLARVPAGQSDLGRMLALEQRFFLSDHNLIYTDKMSMAAGIEVRVPFLDVEVIEFAARVPTGLKQRGRVGKWVLKKAMEPLLPADVIYRPKTGFGAPLRRWMRNELRPLVADVLAEERVRSRGLFDAAAVRRLVAANDAGTVDAAYTLLSLIAIEIWCARYLDAGAPVMVGNEA